MPEPEKSWKRGPQKILLYFWGEGANEQKTNKWMKRVCLVKSEICDAYTRIFGTRQEPQKFIKFSDSSGNILIKFLPFYRGKGTPKDTFVLLGRRSKRAKDKQMNEKSLFGQKWDLRRVHYDFQNPPRKTQSHQILAVLSKMDIIKFSAFSGNILIKSRV